MYTPPSSCERTTNSILLHSPYLSDITLARPMTSSPTQSTALIPTPSNSRLLLPECKYPSLRSFPIAQSPSLHFIYPLFYDQALLLYRIHDRRMRDLSTSNVLTLSPMNLSRRYIAPVRRPTSPPLYSVDPYHLYGYLTTRQAFRTEPKDRLESLVSLLWIREMVNARRRMVLQTRVDGSMTGIITAKRMVPWRRCKGSLVSRRRSRLRFSRILW